MATIPRYQNLGVQYADLPRVSTAAQQARAQGFDSLSRSLDRLTASFQDQAVTNAKKEGLKYAIENPLTQEQVNKALGTEQGLAVAGAGSVFQETYQKAQSVMLSNELQLEGQRKLSNLTAMIEAGSPVDLTSAQADIKDMIDGYATSVMALDPEQSVKLRSALSTAGNAVFEKATAQAIKIQKAEYTARIDQAITESTPLIEAIIGKAGTIDPTTGQEIDVDALIEIQRQPYLSSIAVTGSNELVKKFNQIVADAKIGALTSKLDDANFAGSPVQALARINAGDFGNLSGVWKRMSNEDQAKVRANVLKSYADTQSAADLSKKAADQANEQKGRVLGLELLNPNTSSSRSRQIVANLVSIGQMTIAQADAHLNGESGAGNVSTFLSLNDQIARGQVKSLSDLTKYKTVLSDAQYKSLGMSITSTQGSQASKMIRLESGIADNAFSITNEQKSKQQKLLGMYSEELGAMVADASGVMVPVSPTAAAKMAIEKYNQDKTEQANQAKRDSATARIRKALEAKGIDMPALPVDEIEFGKIKGLSAKEIATLQAEQNKFKQTLQ